MSSSNDTSWQSIARKAQARRKDSIQRVNPPIPNPPSKLPLDVSRISREVFSIEEQIITIESNPELLVQALGAGRMSSTTVTKAFLRVAGFAQSLTNCITELLPERALERARYLDEYYQQHGRPIGPLHGLPISIKEQVSMKGAGVNIGWISLWTEGTEDANILRILWRAGCVFYARTTEPQSIMHLETSSNLYGTTVNPFNRSLTSGGSSGGEGALIGLRGSCLGIGTDIGGSVRSPAANCGIYSLRPTTHRVPIDGCGDTAPGQEQILGVAGPMSSSLEGLRLFMKTVIDSKPWLMEPLIHQEWKEQDVCPDYTEKNKLKVAIMWNDGVVTPHPPIQRALESVAAKLKSLDWVEIADWEPYKHAEAWNIISTLYFPEGGATDLAAAAASGEPLLPLTKFIITENPNCHTLSPTQLFDLVHRRDAYRTAYLAHWNATGTATDPNSSDLNDSPLPIDLTGTVDIILCPVGPGVAPKLDTSRYWGYTSVWNLVDWPALALPVRKVDVERDVNHQTDERNREPLSEEDKLNRKRWDDAGGAKGFEGAPVGLQIVGRRGEEEKLLEITARIQKAIDLPFDPDLKPEGNGDAFRWLLREEERRGVFRT